MADRKSLVVIGGTSGLGLEIARRAVARGEVVTISGRDAARASAVAAELGGDATGIAVNIADPMQITRSLADVGEVDHLVLSAIERDQNTVADYDVTRAIYLSTLKLVGYIEVVHALHSRLTPTGSIVLFGGLAKERPYPGSTTVSTINGGVTGMVKTLAVEMALRILDEADAWDDALVRGACDWLATVAPAERREGTGSEFCGRRSRSSSMSVHLELRAVLVAGTLAHGHDGGAATP